MRCLSPWLLAWLWWRGRKDPGYRLKLGQRLGRIEPKPSSLHGILIHAASVGEVQAAQSLIAALRAHWPDHTITVTTQTPTGARALQSEWGDALQHLYFPMDTPGATARFLDRLQPRLVIVIEREIWPEWLLQCRARAIPVALVNARLSEKSAASYKRLSGLMGPVWRGLSLVAAADRDSGDRLVALGLPPDKRIFIGNLKFDQKPAASAGPKAPQIPLINRPMIVAGSTHEGEESALLDAWPEFLTHHPGAVLVIVPRHPERFEDVARLMQIRGLRFARRSQDETPDPLTSLWLGDTMGELGAWYAQAHLCFIGGTLVPIGGHNPLEAMAQGKPVLFGPHTANAAALYNAIEQSQSGQRIESAAQAFSTAAQWMASPATLPQLGEWAQAFVRQQQGGSESTLQALKALWAPLQPALLHPVTESCRDGTTIWHKGDLPGTTSPNNMFDPGASNTESLATGSGRGQAQRMILDGQDVVLRHYRRGGLIARFNPDRYRLAAARDSRGMREFALLRWMSASDLPVPAPVAARQVIQGRQYTADIIVSMIPETQNLVQRLVTAPLSAEQWQAVGRAIRLLHDAQVFHSDLNAHNILLSDNGKAWIVDFDKCDIRPDGEWKSGNLKRLERSLRKEAGRLAVFHWQPEDLSPLLAGYGSIDGGADTQHADA